MAGFIVSVSKATNLENLIRNGTYASNLPKELDSAKSKMIAYSTLADYFSIKCGDNIYFLKERKIYGVGKIVEINNMRVFENYLNSSCFNNIDNTVKTLDGNDDSNARWLCFFEPELRFFKNGVDMDDVLRYKPSSFRMLRAFQDRTFIKIDDEENSALKEFIYLQNRNNNLIYDYNYEKLDSFLRRELYNYLPNNRKLLENNRLKDGRLSLEMLLEAVLIKYINEHGIFNENWDYVSHQVIASPFKPLSYIDKMDIFAYRFLEYPHENKPIEKYLVLELKKDKADINTIQQTMRYVDWICNEYASGDYSLVTAGVIAFEYGNLDSLQDAISRTFISSTHPIVTKKWNDLTCLTYRVLESCELELKEYKYFNKEKYIKDEFNRLEISYETSVFTRNKETMKSIIHNKESKFAFVNSAEKNTINILKSINWTVCIIDEDDNQDQIQSKINALLEIKK